MVHLSVARSRIHSALPQEGGGLSFPGYTNTEEGGVVPETEARMIPARKYPGYPRRPNS